MTIGKCKECGRETTGEFCCNACRHNWACDHEAHCSIDHNVPSKVVKSAKGVKGFLLYSPVTHKYFFRIYDEEDKRKFVDYDLCADDIEIEIIDTHLELSEVEGKGRLEYSRKVLGKD